MAFLKRLRSSAFSMAWGLAPIISTPYFSRTPLLARASAVFRAVCPPTVGSRASGLSRSMTASTNSGVIGSMYVRSPTDGSVMIVAGLELMRTTSYPSALRALQACVPE